MWIGTGIVITGLFVFLQCLIAMLIRRHKRRRAAQRQLSRDANRCRRCGYLIEHLSIPRCPECGALRGFTKTADELGIQPDELKF